MNDYNIIPTTRWDVTTQLKNRIVTEFLQLGLTWCISKYNDISMNTHAFPKYFINISNNSSCELLYINKYNVTVLNLRMLLIGVGNIPTI